MDRKVEWKDTTKLCHRCGFKNNELALSDREWTCPECKTHHDRDINAAINIKMIGLNARHTSREPREEPVELSHKGSVEVGSPLL